MKIKLFLILTALWLFPADGQARLCYGPGHEYIYSDICKDNLQPSQICENAGYKLNKTYLSYVYCMDKNCLLGKDETGCQLCTSESMYVKGEKCAACPSNATCDGQNIISCPDGMFINDSQCSSCHSSCKTCLGAKNNNCTSCDSRKYLSDGQCVDCPANAVCDGSSYFSCDTGYIKSDGACVKEEQEPTKTNTVNTCPSRMTLSADGCCCVNK